jgi:hypothetical protein
MLPATFEPPAGTAVEAVQNAHDERTAQHPDL